MTAPTFRCTAFEPPLRKGGMYGSERVLDSEGGLILDEFVFDHVVHIEEMSDGYYYCRVGKHVFAIYRKGGKWQARLHEVTE